MTNYFELAARDARHAFATTRPHADAPKQCCADHAVETESDAQRAIWRCGICGCLWAVPHAPQVRSHVVWGGGAVPPQQET